MNTSRQISNRNRQLNLTQDISSSFNPYIFSKHDRAFHHHVTEHPVHHFIIDSLSMTEYLVATKRSAQRSGEHRHRKEAWIAQKREPPKKPPVAPSVREGHATTPGFKVQPGRIAHTTRKGGWSVYILFTAIKVHATGGSSSPNTWTFSPYTRPLPSSNRRYSYDPPVLPLRDRMIEYNRPPSKRNGAG